MADGRSDTAGVIAPPPLIYLAFLLAGVGLDRLRPAGLGLGAAGDWVGGALALAGLALLAACALGFRKAGTAIEPYRPTPPSSPRAFMRIRATRSMSRSRRSISALLSSTTTPGPSPSSYPPSPSWHGA